MFLCYYLSLEREFVTTDSLRISQKREESNFISFLLASGHCWMHDKGPTAFFAWQRGAPVGDHRSVVPSIIRTSHTDVRQSLAKPAILFWFVSLPLPRAPFPTRPQRQTFISCERQGLRRVSRPLAVASPVALPSFLLTPLVLWVF